MITLPNHGFTTGNDYPHIVFIRKRERYKRYHSDVMCNIAEIVSSHIVKPILLISTLTGFYVILATTVYIGIMSYVIIICIVVY